VVRACTVDEEEWLVERILPRRSYVGLFGRRSTAKSFIAIELAARGAIGQPFLGEATETFGTLYCVGEKRARFGKRIKAWMIANGAAGVPRGVLLRWAVPNLLDAAEVAAFIEDVEHLKADFAGRGAPLELVIIDTLARALKHKNVSDADAAGIAIEAIQKIVAACGVTVLAVAHVAKTEGSATQKGAGEWEDAADALIRVDRRDGERIRTVTLTKQSDEADGLAYGFELEVVDVGETKRGRRVTSCVIRQVDLALETGPNAPAKKLTGAGLIVAQALAFLVDNFLTHPAPPLPGIPRDARAVKLDDWKARAGEMGLWDQEDTPTNRRQKWHTAKLKCRDAGLVRIEGEWAMPLGPLGGR
jgi:hypothetical protein